MQNETKHTPGPWVANGTKEQPEVWGAGPFEDGGLVASLSTVGSFQAARDEKTVQANAALIAAAPALLEALKALLEMHKPHHNSMEHVSARAAIAKATQA